MNSKFASDPGLSTRAGESLHGKGKRHLAGGEGEGIGGAVAGESASSCVESSQGQKADVHGRP